MTPIPNDDFDMCCGNRPHVTALDGPEGGYRAECGVCGFGMQAKEVWRLVEKWNKDRRAQA